MSLAFAGLEARRTVTVAAALCALGVTVLALIAHAGAAEGPGSLTGLQGADGRVDLSRVPAAWRAGLTIAAAWCVIRSAGLTHAWFGGAHAGEGSWLALTRLSRFAIAGWALAGITMGGAALTLAMAGSIAWLAPADNERTPMEPMAVAGPIQSELLLPGDQYEQSFSDLDPPEGSTVRIHMTPAAGAIAGTTRVEVTAGDAVIQRPLARKSWVEAPLAEGVRSVRTQNIGDGAAALLGPRPVQIWRPSSAFLRGHLRLWLHACALIAFLTGATLAAGLWMSAAVSTALSLSAWLFLMATDVGPGWIPGTTDMGVALSALGDGRVPASPARWTWIAAGAAHLAAALMATRALRSWHREDRA